MKLLECWLRGWRNIRLKNKLVLLIGAATLVMGGASLGASVLMTRSYDGLLYEKTADSLAMLANEIRTDAQAVSYVSDFLATNSTVQQDLARLKVETDPLRRSECISSLRRTLNSYLFYSAYLMSITLYDEAGGTLIHIGRDNWQPQGALLARARETARALAGREGWLSTGSDREGVLCTRMIRRIESLSLDDLAHLVLQVDMQSLAGDAQREISDNTRLLLVSGGEALYPAGWERGTRRLYENLPPTGRYSILRLEGEKLFAVSRQLPEYGWQCVTVTDYSQVFRSVVVARTLFVALVLLVTGATIVLSNAVVGSILEHLNRLLRKMDRYAQGDLAPVGEGGADYAARGDELGILHRRFDGMVARIGQLIQDNYVKQLLLQDSRLKALEAQINPHFLYNTLDSINWQAKASGETRISEMAEALGGLMRSTLSGKEDCIPLRVELAIIEYYIKIQRIRYEDRLCYEQRVEEGLLGALVPKMSIQPLVDNAVKHALEELSDLCVIRLSVCQRGEDIEVAVFNNGSQIEEDVLEKLQSGAIAPGGTGVGLLNIEKRVKLLYGPAYGLAFQNGEDCVTAIMRIPCQKEEGANG